MSDRSIARDELRALVERIERLNEELDAVNADKRDIYAEAKSRGFDVKVLKKVVAERGKDLADRQEFEAIFDLYCVALGMKPDTASYDDAPRARARAHEAA